jgi:hypothetical protein
MGEHGKYTRPVSSCKHGRFLQKTFKIAVGVVTTTITYSPECAFEANTIPMQSERLDCWKGISVSRRWRHTELTIRSTSLEENVSFGPKKWPQRLPWHPPLRLRMSIKGIDVFPRFQARRENGRLMVVLIVHGMDKPQTLPISDIMTNLSHGRLVRIHNQCILQPNSSVIYSLVSVPTHRHLYPYL